MHISLNKKQTFDKKLKKKNEIRAMTLKYTIECENNYSNSCLIQGGLILKKNSLGNLGKLQFTKFLNHRFYTPFLAGR